MHVERTDINDEDEGEIQARAPHILSAVVVCVVEPAFLVLKEAQLREDVAGLFKHWGCGCDLEHRDAHFPIADLHVVVAAAVTEVPVSEQA